MTIAHTHDLHFDGTYPVQLKKVPKPVQPFKTPSKNSQPVQFLMTMPIQEDGFTIRGVINNLKKEFLEEDMRDIYEKLRVGQIVNAKIGNNSFVAKVMDVRSRGDLFKIGPTIFLGNRAKSDIS